MTDNVAGLARYTQSIVAHAETGPERDLYLRIKPGTDLDSCFKAWDADGQEFLWINGWMFTYDLNP